MVFNIKEANLNEFLELNNILLFLISMCIIKSRLEKNHDFFFNKKKSHFFKFKLDLLFELIIFSSKKIIKFYYKIINVLFFLLSLLNFNLL